MDTKPRRILCSRGKTTGAGLFSHGLTGRYGTMASMPDTGRILTCGYGF
jgi:hypothetical protein